MLFPLRPENGPKRGRSARREVELVGERRKLGKFHCRKSLRLELKGEIGFPEFRNVCERFGERYHGSKRRPPGFRLSLLKPEFRRGDRRARFGRPPKRVRRGVRDMMESRFEFGKIGHVRKTRQQKMRVPK